MTVVDSTELYRKALAFFSNPNPSPPPPPHLPLPPIPSTFPHSKLIPGTRFAVDAFRHAGDFSVTYFLSHFHSDHYSGLSPSWSHGLVFCSPVTASLLTHVLRLSPLFVVPLPLNHPHLVDGCHVSLVDANHCPGAVQFLFRLPRPDRKYLHTGDFRFAPSAMTSDPLVASFIGCDAVFLDTTYCDPKFVFPSQEESIDYVCNVIEAESDKNNVLFLVATYVIGKEKILLEIARRCGRKVCVDARKMEVLSVLGYGGESGVFTEDEGESNVHVVGWNVLGETWPYFRPNFAKMEEIMYEKGYLRVVGFVPTGWTYEVKRSGFSVRSKDALEIHLVPYSEHSNYDELREYVRFLKPKRVIPTVGSDVEKIDSKHAAKMQKHFAGLVDEMANKKEFLRGFCSRSNEVDGKFDTDANDDYTIDGEHPKEKASTFAFDTDVGAPIQSTSPHPEPDSQAPVLLNDENEEELIKELCVCLPSWVTRQQMLELIRSSGGDIVEAVSKFYDCETEFRAQAIPSASDISSVSQTSESYDTASPSKVYSFFANIDVSSSRVSPNPSNIIIKSGISPGKRGKNTRNKVNKKAKLPSKLESCGPKQSSITRFFSKVSPDATARGEAESLGEKDPNDKKLPDHGTEPYKNAVDQFLQIIDGNETLESYAARIIQKSNGDVSRAVDMHYSNEGKSCQNEMELVAEKNSNQANSGVDNVCANSRMIELGNIGQLYDSSVHPSLPDDRVTNSVSLPLEEYNPVEHACWSNGQSAPYLHLARTFDLLEKEKGKIKATYILCNMFRSLLALSPNDVLPSVYLCTNKIAADHKNVELNIGGSLVTSALEDACGTSRSKIRDMYNEMGDLGDVAQACRQTQSLLAPPAPLLIKDVYSGLWKISVQTGSGSSARKKNLIVNLMRSCREKEIKFLVRTLVRNLRIGAMMKTVLPALAQAVVLNSFHSCNHKGTIESLKDKLQRHSAAVVEAYNVLPSLDLVVPSLMNRGIGFSSSTLSMVPGIPIKPMLARITNGVQQSLKLFENKAFTCEYKYDGQRAQIHKLEDGSVHIFSRNGDESTLRFPDLINIINQAIKPEALTFILDAEVVGVDRKNGCKLLSFQELSSRGRGGRDGSITLDNLKVDICVFVFDIMFANGQQLLSFPLRRRRKYLKDMFYDEKLGYFEYAKEMTVEAEDAFLTCETTIANMNSFLENAFASSCEGIMVKCLDVDAGYSPSKRTDTWLKVKRDYMEGLRDSLDLVPIGAWHGNGRKAGWYSPFLMACYNPETEEFQSVCRVMSGFSDSFYTEMRSFYSGDKVLANKPPYYRTAEVPDMWFSAELVWEIRGADFTVSPVHQAALGLVHPSRGISIRFPRYVRTVNDRKPDECSTASDIAEMFHSQTRKMDVAFEDGRSED